VNARCEGDEGPAELTVPQRLRRLGVSRFVGSLNCDLGHAQLDDGIATIDLRISICPYATPGNPVTISGGRSAILLYFLTLSRNFQAAERLKL